VNSIKPLSLQLELKMNFELELEMKGKKEGGGVPSARAAAVPCIRILTVVHLARGRLDALAAVLLRRCRCST